MFTKLDNLKCSGKDIVNERGEKVVLRGTNFGGWLLREGWMDTGAFEIPLQSDEIIYEPNNRLIIFDFGRPSRWNRFELAGGLEGEYGVYSSEDGINWRCEWCGIPLGLKEAPFDEQRPVSYDIQGNAYKKGIYIKDRKVCFPEVQARFCKITGDFNLEDVVVSRFGDVDEYISRKTLEERFGVDGTESLLETYQKVYITKEDIDYVKNLGFNFVRIPIYWQEIMDKEGNIKDNAWDELDWIVEQCRDKEIYLMLDYHGAPGGNTSGSITCGQLDSNELWNNKVYQEMSCKIWKSISERYKEEPTIAAYDLLNEPATAWYQSMEGALKTEEETGEVYLCDDIRKTICAMYDKLYHSVRQTGDLHIISMQPFVDWDLLGNPSAHEWSQIMYQIHCYAGDWRSEEGTIKEVRRSLGLFQKYQKQWNIPILAGEFCFWEFEKAWDIWLSGLEELEIHWSNWTYKNVDPNKKDNWSIFYDFQGIFADLYNNSYEEIQNKFSCYSSNYYKKNEVLEKILRKWAGGI